MMMKKLSLRAALVGLLCSFAVQGGSAKLKYVFYFISDGTGVNIVQAGEHYRAAINAPSTPPPSPPSGGVWGANIPPLGGSEGGSGSAGYAPLPYTFTGFPVVGMATTYSASTRVTDSSASGTALATGVKTTNGYLGVLPDGVTPVESICRYAKQKGMRVGVASSVGVDHATPGSFYGHDKSRNSYHTIGHQMIDCDYVDFFGGGGLNAPTDKRHPDEPSLYELAEQQGLTVAYGYDDYKAKAAGARRMLLVQSREDLARNGSAVPYVIDREPNSLTIEDILRAEIDFLMKGNPKGGFFLMNEIGGRVDWADHSNDAATAFAELEGVDNCVKIALDFYKQHPDETLILLTADHDTGGPSIGVGKYEMTPKVLQHQTISKDKLSDEIKKWRNERGDSVITWEEARQLLTKSFGFWETVKLNERQEKMLHEAYERTFTPNKDRGEQKGLYSTNENLSVVATRIINDMASVAWAHGSHTGGYVPVYVIGRGAEAFCKMNDNAQIPRIIARLLGIEMK